MSGRLERVPHGSLPSWGGKQLSLLLLPVRAAGAESVAKDPEPGRLRELVRARQQPTRQIRALSAGACNQRAQGARGRRNPCATEPLKGLLCQNCRKLTWL